MTRSLAALAAVVLLCGMDARADKGAVQVWKLPLEAKLEQNISCEFQATPLPEVVEFFRNTLKINLVLDPDAAVAQADQLVTLSLKDLPAKTVLGWALRQAGLTYTFADGAVYIASKQRAAVAEAPAAYRVWYDVSDLLLPIDALAAAATSGTTGATGVAATSTVGNYSNSSATGGYTNSNQSGTTNAMPSSANAAADLMRFLVIMTGPENWDQVIILGTTNNTSGAGTQSLSRDDRF